MGKLLDAFTSGIKSTTGQAELAAFHNQFNQFIVGNPNSYSMGGDDRSEMKVYKNGYVALINSTINRKMTDVRNRDYYFKYKGKRVEFKDVPIEIKMPFENGYAGLSLAKMLGIVCGHEDLSGNALWLKNPDVNLYFQKNNIAGQFIPITPGNFKITLNQRGTEIEIYTITWKNGEKSFYTPDKVIQFKRDTLISPFNGIGLISQERALVEYEKVAQQYQTTFMEKDGTPDLIYIDKDAKGLRSEMIKSKGDQLRAEYKAGKFSNSIMYAPGDADIKSFAVSSSDLQFIETRKFNREDIISIMESSPIVLGMEKEAGNYAIANKATQNYFTRVNGRIYDFIETLNMLCVWKIKGNENKDYELSFDPYPTGDIEEIQKAVTNGLMTPNQAAKQMGYPADDKNEAANVLYVNAGLRTLDYAYNTEPLSFGGGLSDPAGDVKKKTKIRDYE